MLDEGSRQAQHVPKGPDVLGAWRATRTQRWHSDPDLAGSGDDTGGHSGRVALLALLLFPGEPVLLAAAAIHDLGESAEAKGPGDVSATAKRACPQLKAVVDDAEAGARARLRLPGLELSEADHHRLTFLDRLDALLWMRHKAPWLEVQDNWTADRRWLETASLALGLGPACGGVL